MRCAHKLFYRVDFYPAWGVCSDGNPTNARYDGINILVSINYEMTGVSGSGLQYTYIPRLLSDLEYKIEEPQIINGVVLDVVILRKEVLGPSHLIWTGSKSSSKKC